MKGECYSYQTAEFGYGDRRKKKRKTRDDGSYHTAQFGLGDRGRKKIKKCIVFDLDLI